MNKRAWSPILTAFLVFTALIICFAMLSYTLAGVQSTQNTTSEFYNMTGSAISMSSGILPKLFLAGALILVVILFIWGLSYLMKK